MKVSKRPIKQIIPATDWVAVYAVPGEHLLTFDPVAVWALTEDSEEKETEGEGEVKGMVEVGGYLDFADRTHNFIAYGHQPLSEEDLERWTAEAVEWAKQHPSAQPVSPGAHQYMTAPAGPPTIPQGTTARGDSAA